MGVFHGQLIDVFYSNVRACGNLPAALHDNSILPPVPIWRGSVPASSFFFFASSPNQDVLPDVDPIPPCITFHLTTSHLPPQHLSIPPRLLSLLYRVSLDNDDQMKQEIDDELRHPVVKEDVNEEFHVESSKSTEEKNHWNVRSSWMNATI
ncbi:hypothetical protein L1987_09785 [Smallanthus sonchifolius]|uniref:Uncharacterized protein n=1 Tax=Smallanthus sonchifolius TaxID=185202 RepID=A0ACB9JQB4_9ASTR|nr:hypothetical protein L1987_09785 [Smallanthus sonchifolius]